MNKLKKHLKRLVIFSLIIIAILIIFNQIPTPFYMVRPGITMDLSEIITVEGGDKTNSGDFLLTSVSSHQASLLNYLSFILFEPEDTELQAAAQQLPEGVDMQEYVEIMRRLMNESQLVAQVVALEEAGYEAEITGEGVEIVKVLEESKAEDRLQEGDIIVAVDGISVQLAREVIDRVQDREIGEPVNLTLMREADTAEVEVPTVEHTEQPGQAAVGVLIRSYNLDFELPLEVNIKTEDIIGPSAGTMFALEILNQLLDEDLTGGHIVAGTGTVSLEGKVGPISGLKHKINAAERDGADVFLVPEDNLTEDLELDTQIELIIMNNFDDLLDQLRLLGNI